MARQLLALEDVAQVLDLMCTGLNDGEMGTELHVARKTVNNHVLRAQDMLHAKNRAHLAAIWTERKLKPTP